MTVITGRDQRTMTEPVVGEEVACRKVRTVGEVPEVIAIEGLDGEELRYALVDADGEQAAYEGPCPGCAVLRPGPDGKAQFPAQIRVPVERRDSKGVVGLRFFTVTNRLTGRAVRLVAVPEHNFHPGCFIGAVLPGPLFSTSGWRRAARAKDWGEYTR